MGDGSRARVHAHARTRAHAQARTRARAGNPPHTNFRLSQPECCPRGGCTYTSPCAQNALPEGAGPEWEEQPRESTHKRPALARPPFARNAIHSCVRSAGPIAVPVAACGNRRATCNCRLATYDLRRAAFRIPGPSSKFNSGYNMHSETMYPHNSGIILQNQKSENAKEGTTQKQETRHQEP